MEIDVRVQMTISGPSETRAGGCVGRQRLQWHRDPNTPGASSISSGLGLIAQDGMAMYRLARPHTQSSMEAWLRGHRWSFHHVHGNVTVDGYAMSHQPCPSGMSDSHHT
nr:hypothetical protein CFP56_01195 [Quercus suber]